MIDLTPYTDSNGDIDLKKELIQKLAGVVTSGSNENGRYIRFSDGTQISWGSTAVSHTATTWGSLFATDYIYFTFASSFIEKPTCTLSYLISTGGTAWEIISSVNLTGGDGYLARTSDGELVGRLHYMAIGRWK